MIFQWELPLAVSGGALAGAGLFLVVRELLPATPALAVTSSNFPLSRFRYNTFPGDRFPFTTSAPLAKNRSGQPSLSKSTTPTPEPNVSNICFSGEAPFSWRNVIPASRAISLNCTPYGAPGASRGGRPPFCSA